MRTRFRALFVFIALALLPVFSFCKSSENNIIKDPHPAKTAQVEETIDQYMQIKSVINAQGGKNDSVYYIGWDTGVNQLYKKQQDKTGMTTDANNFPEGIDGYKISPDGNYIVIIADKGGDEQYDLYLLNIETNALNEVDSGRETRAENIIWQPDESGFYYRSTRRTKKDFDIWYYDLKNAKAKIFKELEGYNWLNDISEDGKHMLYKRYWGGHMVDLHEIDLSRKTTRQLSKADNQQGDYSSATYVGNNIYFITDKSLDTTALAKMTEPERWEKLSSSKWAIELMAISKDGKTIAYTYNEHGYSKLELRTIENFELIPIEDLPSGTSIISELEFVDDGLLFAASDASHTSEIWKLDMQTKRATQVTFSDYAGVDTKDFVQPELVFYESFDGLKIPAFLYKPKGYEDKPAAYMIYAHGGPESQFRPQFIRSYQFLAKQGIGVLAPNVRGSDGYGREYLAMDNYKKRYDAIKDFKYAALWLIENNIADKQKIAISGGSYGGFVTMACITEYPDLFAAAIDKVGVVNYLTYFKNTRGYRKKVREGEYGPTSDPEFLKSISPIFKIDRVKTPLLVVHGENDPRVPVSEARQIIESLEKQNKPVEALIFPDEGHGIGKLENRLVYYRKMLEFLKRYLKL